jgi:hypothetical protein
MHTKEEFLNMTVSDISQVYLGKRHHCRCGCGGTYTSTSYMDRLFAGDSNDSVVAKRLKRAQKLVREGADVDYGNTYIDIETGANKSLTFYTDELKAICE